MSIIREYVRQWKSFNKNIQSFLLFDICNRFSIAIYVLFFPRFLLELGHKEDLYGSLMGISTLMVALMAIIAGVISDRIGRKQSMMIGFGISKITYFLRAFIAIVPVLYAAHIVDGLVLPLSDATVNPFIYENSDGNNRIAAFSARGILMRVATIIGNIVGGFLPFVILYLMPGSNTIFVYRVIFGFSLIVAVLGFFFLMQIGTSPEEEERKTHRSPSLKEIFSSTSSKDRSFISKYVIEHALISCGAGMFLPFMNTYFLRKFNAGSDITGVLFSISDFVVITGLMLAPLLAERMGMTRSILFCRIFTFPLFFVMAFFPNLYVVAAAFMLRSMLQQMSGPLYSSFFMENVSGEVRASANGVFTAFGEAARATGMFASGYIIVNLGYEAIFMIAMLFYIAAAIAFYNFFVRKPPETSQA